MGDAIIMMLNLPCICQNLFISLPTGQASYQDFAHFPTLLVAHHTCEVNIAERFSFLNCMPAMTIIRATQKDNILACD